MTFKISFKKLVFFALVLLIFLFFLFLKINLFSGEKVFLEIVGPSEVEFSKEVEFLVKIKNNSRFRIENPELFFDPPKSSFFEGKPFERQVVSKEILGDFIYPGQEKAVSFKFQVFGGAFEKKEARATLFFTPKNVKSRFKRETNFTFVITPPSVNLSLDLPSQVPSQKEFEIYITYYSNAETPLTNLYVMVETPPGFRLIQSVPSQEGQNTWKINVLNYREGGKVKILGRFEEESKEPKLFSAKLGYLEEGKFLTLKEVQKATEITKPLIFLRQEVQGVPEYVAKPGEILHFKIYFKNIGQEAVPNLILISKLEGEAFDFESLKVEKGTIEKAERAILVDSKSLPILQYLMPQEEGTFEFWIRVRDDIENVSDLYLKNTVFLGPAKNEFLVKVQPKFDLLVNGFFEDEIFGNFGSLPPKVGQKTTYTILWKIKSYQSGCNKGKVVAKLGENVNFSGRIFPQEEEQNFLFDSQNKEILWEIQNLAKNSEKSLALQIEFLPKENQRGKIVDLILNSKFSCFDEFSQKEIQIQAPNLSTLLNPEIDKQKAIVQ